MRAYAKSPAAVVGAVLVLAVLVMALLAPVLYPNDPLGLAGRPLQWPGTNPRFPLGTDPSGRDIMAQLRARFRRIPEARKGDSRTGTPAPIPPNAPNPLVAPSERTHEKVRDPVPCVRTEKV